MSTDGSGCAQVALSHAHSRLIENYLSWYIACFFTGDS